MAMTHERASAAQREAIKSLFGKADLDSAGVETLRSIIVDTGAHDHLETLISSLFDQSITAIDNPMIDCDAQKMLVQMATIATKRNS
jgi:geranylgeranyl pyrophosphate synthase